MALSYGEDGMDVTLSYVGNSRMSRESLDKWGITWRETLKFNRSKIVTTLNLSYQPSDMGQWDPVTNDIEKNSRMIIIFMDFWHINGVLVKIN